MKLEPDGSIDRSCDFVGGTDVILRDGRAMALNVDVLVSETYVVAKDSSIVTYDTNALAKFLHPSAKAK